MRSIRHGTQLCASMLLGLVFVGAAVADGAAQALPDTIMVAHFIDVGQGAAALLEFSCGAVMIDAGGQASEDTDSLVAYLGRFFDRRTDLDSTIASIIISHNHIDHTRSLFEVATTFRVRNVVENGMRGRPGDPGDRALVQLAAANADSAIHMIELNDHDVVADFGLNVPEVDPVECTGTDPEITVLSADLAVNPGWRLSDFRDKNNHSIVVRVDFGLASFLFTGDLEEPALETLVEYYAETPMLDADVYHVGHHGSHNGTTWSLLEALVEPQIAILSSGPCARSQGLFNAFQFGHPRTDTVEMLRAAIRRRRSTPKRVPTADGVRDFRTTTMRDAVYATGWDGTLTVRATAAGAYRVDQSRSASAPVTCQ